MDMADLAKIRHANFVAWMEANGFNANMIAKKSDVPYTTIKSYVDSQGRASLKGDNEARIAASHRVPVEAIFGAPELPEGEREPNYLAAWRADAGLTVEQVATALKTSVPIVLQLEAGEIDLTNKWMTRLAPLFGTHAGHLLMDPAQAKNDVVLIATEIPKDRQRQAAQVLRALTGTDN